MAAAAVTAPRACPAAAGAAPGPLAAAAAGATAYTTSPPTRTACQNETVPCVYQTAHSACYLTPLKLGFGSLFNNPVWI